MIRHGAKRKDGFRRLIACCLLQIVWDGYCLAAPPRQYISSETPDANRHGRSCRKSRFGEVWTAAPNATRRRRVGTMALQDSRLALFSLWFMSALVTSTAKHGAESAPVPHHVLIFHVWFR